MTKATHIEHIMDYAFDAYKKRYGQSWPGWIEIGMRELLGKKKIKWLNNVTERQVDRLTVQVKKYW